MQIGGKSWPLVAEEGSPSGTPEIPELVDGKCPVCGGSNPLDSEDIDC